MHTQQHPHLPSPCPYPPLLKLATLLKVTLFHGCFSRVLTLLSPGLGGGEGRGVIFGGGKFKFKLFLNGLCYEPETL